MDVKSTLDVDIPEIVYIQKIMIYYQEQAGKPMVFLSGGVALSICFDSLVVVKIVESLASRCLPTTTQRDISTLTS